MNNLPAIANGFKDSFSDFLLSAECRRRWSISPGIHERLSSADIKSLRVLLRWMRRRYPQLYWGYTLFSDGSGHERLLRLWGRLHALARPSKRR